MTKQKEDTKEVYISEVEKRIVLLYRGISNYIENDIGDKLINHTILLTLEVGFPEISTSMEILKERGEI